MPDKFSFAKYEINNYVIAMNGLRGEEAIANYVCPP